MEAKLIKVDTGWILMVDNKIYASHNDILSLKNCQAIENGYDLDELFQREIDELMFTGNLEDPSEYRSGMYKGAKIFLELMGDKKFSEEQLKVAADWYFETKGKKSIDEYIQSLQQTEWDVEIEMEPCFYDDSLGGFSTSYKEGMPTEQPKLDADGCLILKRI